MRPTARHPERNTAGRRDRETPWTERIGREDKWVSRERTIAKQEIEKVSDPDEKRTARHNTAQH